MSGEKFRSSAAVLLTRDEGREVFLVERSSKLSFFGGYWACPGGVLDAVDCEHGEPSSGFTPSESDLARCAARELFEETGVSVPELTEFFARPKAPTRDDLQGQLLAGETAAWGEWIVSEASNWQAFESLRRVCTLTTPPFAPVRYRTEFLHLELRGGEEPVVKPGELVRGEFMRPADVLERWTNGELFVVPPVLFLLRELCDGPLDDALNKAGAFSEEIAAGRLSEIRHTPGVFTAPLRTPTIPPATTTNCYLVGEQEVYVIDPATWEESERERLFNLMDRWIASGKTFKGVLVSHHHHDHIGSVVETAARYQLEVLAHPLTLERLPELPCGSRALVDGDRLELGLAPDGRAGWGLSVYHTPGHDRGHLVFVEDRYGAALVGDLVSTLSTIIIDPPEGHLATYLASLRRIGAMSLGVLYPSHGPAARDGKTYIEKFIAHRGMREEQLVAGLTAGLSGVDQLLERVYRGTPPEIMPLAERSLVAGLEKLAEEGRVKRVRGCWSLCS